MINPVSAQLPIRLACAALFLMAPAAYAAGSACVYQDINYGGSNKCFTSDTTYVGNDWNDRMSSVKITPGYEVQLFEHSNYNGRALKLSGDTANLVSLGFNDIASSLRIVSKCNAADWREGVNYSLGTVVRYAPNGQYYKVVNVTANGTEATNPTISTYFWQPTACGSDGGGGGSGGGLPDRVVAGYYPDWKPSPPRIRDMNSNYNVIYLFAARPVGGAPGTTGEVTWTAPGDGRGAATNLVADIKYARETQHRKIILSVGGAGNGMSFPNRGKSQTFVNSVVGISNRLGGIDGMDWNTFEGNQAPDVSEMIWISKELKNRIPNFLITAPPAPWNQVDKSFCKSMVDAGAMDYCAPQYYDGPGLADQAYVANSVREWVALLGARHVVVGFGINPSLPNYMNRDQAISTWNQVERENPEIRGGFDWEVGTDETQGWPFANGVGPLIGR